jgi:transcriptional regulator with XRE-family HTH domain
MALTTQLKSLLKQRKLRVNDLARLLGLAPSNLSAPLNGTSDTRGSTLEAVAAALDAEWVLVPREHLPEVRQLVAGKGVGPDTSAPTAVDLFLSQNNDKT